MRNRLLAASLLLLTTQGCGKEDKSTSNVVAQHPLVGTWTTVRPDPNGETHFTLTLERDGTLFMVESVSNAGQRSFPGTWQVDGDELVFRGVYFGPNSESMVRFIFVGDTLVLEDTDGSTTEWNRLAPKPEKPVRKGSANPRQGPY